MPSIMLFMFIPDGFAIIEPSGMTCELLMLAPFLFSGITGFMSPAANK